MSKVYHYAGALSTIYHARKGAALTDARRWSRATATKVEVWRTTVRDDLPRLELLEAALNGRGWTTNETEKVATFDKGKLVVLDGAPEAAAA